MDNNKASAKIQESKTNNLLSYQVNFSEYEANIKYDN